MHALKGVNMLHFRFERKRIFIVAALLVTCAVVTIALTPAASGEIRPLLQSLAIISCSSPNPCQEGSNASTGAGLEGISAKGKGVVGQTKFNSTSTSNGQAGVIGNDLSTSGVFNAGVRGVSVRGAGVAGQSTSGAGLSGVSTTGQGVTGSSASSNGITGQTKFNSTSPSNGKAGVLGQDLSTTSVFDSGVTGTSARGTGVEGTTASGTAVDAVASGSGRALNATANTGNGISVSNSGTGADDADFTTGSIAGEATIGMRDGLGVAAEGFAASSSTVPAFNAFCAAGGPAMTATNNFFVDIMSLDCSGNMILSGTLTTSGTPLVSRRSATGARVGTFAAQQTLATVEDVGEAELTLGRAYVRIASDFAGTIDPGANYLVFITPQGESRGLYVTRKTSAGFEVRENQGGTSTLAFDYRIVREALRRVVSALASTANRHASGRHHGGRHAAGFASQGSGKGTRALAKGILRAVRDTPSIRCLERSNQIGRSLYPNKCQG